MYRVMGLALPTLWAYSLPTLWSGHIVGIPCPHCGLPTLFPAHIVGVFASYAAERQSMPFHC